MNGVPKDRLDKAVESGRRSLAPHRLSSTDQTWLDDAFSPRGPEGDDPYPYQRLLSSARALALAAAILVEVPPGAARTEVLQKLRDIVTEAHAAIALKGLV